MTERQSIAIAWALLAAMIVLSFGMSVLAGVGGLG